MIKQVNSNNITNFTLDGKSGSFLQLMPEKKTQVFTMFSGMKKPRVHSAQADDAELYFLEGLLFKLIKLLMLFIYNLTFIF